MFSVNNIPLTHYVYNILFYILDDIICKLKNLCSMQCNDKDQDLEQYQYHDLEQYQDIEQCQDPYLQLENPLQIPELNHNSPIAVPTPKPLSLFMPSIEEQSISMENDKFINKYFVISNLDALSINHPESLGIEKLNKLNKGFLGKNIEEFKINKTITFPDGTIIDI